MDKGCRVARAGEDTGCDHGRRYVRVAYPELEGVYVPFAHHNCVHNQLTAIHNRVCGAVPKPSQRGLRRLRRQAWRLLKFLPCVTPDDWYVLPQYYSGQKRAKYTRATDQVLQAGGTTRRDAGISMFVKMEKLSPSKENPDPRAIQFRDPRFCVDVARFLKPVEHHLYQMRGDGVEFPASRLIGKGLNQVQRAELLRKKMARFSNPIVMSLDCSRFDMHVAKELLQIEHLVYLQMCPDDWFAQLLEWQLRNFGRSAQGVEYVAEGRRMSGDMNTALGNCLLMVLMVSAWLRGRKYDMLDDGDDCLVILEADDEQWARETVGPTFLEFGHEIKIENVATSIHDVTWCQSSVIEFAAGKFKFVRDWRKVLSTSLVGTKFFTSGGGRRKLVNTIGLAELVLNLGVPVLQEFALALLRNADTNQQLDLSDTMSMYHRLGPELKLFNLRQLERLSPQEVTDEARISFSRAFGLSPAEQVAIERRLQCWTFSMEGGVQMPDEWDVPQWIRDAAYSPEAYPL